MNPEGLNVTLTDHKEAQKMRNENYLLYLIQNLEKKTFESFKKAYLQVHNDKKVRTKIAQHACIRCNR